MKITIEIGVRVGYSNGMNYLLCHPYGVKCQHYDEKIRVIIFLLIFGSSHAEEQLEIGNLKSSV